MNKLHGYLRLMRIPNDFIIGLAVLVGEVIEKGVFLSLSQVLFGFLSGFLTSASVMILNDVADVKVDKINAPNRPLPQGIVTIKAAKLFSIILFLLAIATSLLLPILNVTIVILFWILGVLYNLFFKKTGLVGNTIVSLSVAIPFIYGGIAVSNKLSLLIILFSSMAFLTNMGREIIKGIADVKGDKLGEINTLAVRFGSKYAYLIACIFIISAILISPFPLILNITANLLYAPLVLVTDILLLLSIIESSRLYKKACLDAKRHILYAMIIGIFAFLIGSINLHLL